MIKKILKGIFAATGIHVIKRPKHNGSTRFSINDLSYDVVTPYANYSPWLSDTDFTDIYYASKPNSVVDIYRCYELWSFAEKIVKMAPDANFIEIGVWRGGTASIIGRKLSLLHSNVKFYLADTFTGVKKSSDKDSFYFDNEHADTSEEIVSQLLKDKYDNYEILKGMFPEETAFRIEEDKRFGFCHIDVDVYNSSKDIVDWIWDRMIIGGVIIFDDYGFHTCDGVTKYVNEQKSKTDRMVIYNLNGHAVMIKLR